MGRERLVEMEEGGGVLGGDFGDLLEGGGGFGGEPVGNVFNIGGLVFGGAVGMGGEEGGVSFEKDSFKWGEREGGVGGHTVDADVEIGFGEDAVEVLFVVGERMDDGVEVGEVGDDAEEVVKGFADVEAEGEVVGGGESEHGVEELNLGLAVLFAVVVIEADLADGY